MQLQIQNGVDPFSPNLIKLTGSKLPNNVYGYGQGIRLHFKSDLYFTESGYSAKFTGNKLYIYLLPNLRKHKVLSARAHSPLFIMITCNSHSKSKMEINCGREIGIHLGGKFQYFE